MEKFVGVCFIVSGSGKFTVSGGTLGLSCVAVLSLLAWLRSMHASVLLTFFEASPLIYLFFICIFSHSPWPVPLGGPSLGAKIMYCRLIFDMFLVFYFFTSLMCV